MASNLDSVIDSIVTSNAETPQLLLKSWLDQFYTVSTTAGLSSSQLIKMVTFICNSPTLAMTTRLYITEKCLLPNDYISEDLIKVVISQLGTATAISDSRLQVPEKIQVSLCKWLVHVFFLFSSRDEPNALQPNSSIWLHLWQFDFLQHWLTYIVLWTTTSPKDVKRWKVLLLGKVGAKPNYRDSQACSTLILRRFESVAGQSELITRTIADVRCNQRRLRSLQSLEYDKDFMTKLRAILLNRPSSRFTEDILNELIASSLDQLKFSVMNKGNNTSSFIQSVKETTLLNTQSLSKLASQWDTIVVPLNVEQFLRNIKRSPCHLYLLSLSSGSKFWTIACRWLRIHLGLLFKKGQIHQCRSQIDDIIRICQIYGVLTTVIIREFFTPIYLNANPEAFLLLFKGLFSIPANLEVNHEGFSRSSMQVVATSLLKNEMKVSVFPSLADVIILFLSNTLRVNNQEWTASSLELVQNIHELLISTFSNVVENRRATLAIMKALRCILFLHQQVSFKSDLKLIIPPPGVIRRQFISDDPLLLDACCYYLVRTRNFLIDEGPSNKFVQLQNTYILDLTNYLWRNKMIESKGFIGMPSEFLEAVIENLYLPDVVMKAKTIFSITGIPALSYTCTAKVRDLETANRVSASLLEPFSEDSFRVFKRSESFDHWLPNVTSLKELKIEILKALDGMGPYNNIAAFLFTYLKSLSHYSTAI